MKLNRIAALASMSAMILTVGSAMAATAPVTVKWNTQKSAAIVLYEQTTASQSAPVAPAANDIFWGGNGSLTSNCNGTESASKDGATNGGWAAGAINFGNVTPDGTAYTNCLEINALEAYVTTNDGAGVAISAALAGTPVGYGTAIAGSQLCLLKDGTWNTASATTYTASGLSAPVAMTSTTACSSGIALGTASTPILNSTVAATQDLNSDMQLNLGPNSTVGSVSATLTYTVTPN
jgi:hypothetical protein